MLCFALTSVLHLGLLQMLHYHFQKSLHKDPLKMDFFFMKKNRGSCQKREYQQTFTSGQLLLCNMWEATLNLSTFYQVTRFRVRKSSKYILYVRHHGSCLSSVTLTEQVQFLFYMLRKRACIDFQEKQNPQEGNRERGRTDRDT